MIEYTTQSLGNGHGEHCEDIEWKMFDGETEIGEAYIIIVEGENETAYVDWIEIYGDNKGKGLGTKFLQHLVEEYGLIYLAPNNEDAKRLYERIGEDFYESQYSYWPECAEWGNVDQGFGVYVIK